MSPLLLLALALGTPQDTVFIPRVSKDTYLSAVRELNKAADLISEDPGVAVEKATSLLANSKIKYSECKFKIEVAPQEFQYENYFPYQVRGKARMALAEKAEPQNAVTILTAAIDDFKASADKKVPGSAELMKKAEIARDKEIAKIPKDDPIDKFRRQKFDPLIRDDKFKSAAALVTGDEGKVLTEEQRRMLVAEAEDGCRAFVADRIYKIRGYLSDIGSVRTLKELGDSGFRQQFVNQVPPEGELTEKAAQDPALVWIRRHIKTLKSIQLGQAKLEDVFAAANEGLATDAPDAEGENPWFRAMALYGSDLVEGVITTCTQGSESKTKLERANLQAEADRALAAWKQFADKTDKKVQERHPELGTRSKRLDQAVKAFPVELTQLGTYDIDRCFNGDPTKDPSKELLTLEQGLLDLVSNLKTMGRVAIESRQELYTKLIIAGTLRRLIDGVAEEQVIRDFADHRPGLKNAGGPVNPERYGPRVKRVFDKLMT